MNNRFLNMAYAVEVVNGRLNGSAEQVENNKSGYNNTTYVKKIGGRGVVSAVCQKNNMRNFCKDNGLTETLKTKVDKKVLVNPDPFANGIDDIFGFMKADNDKITEEDYKILSKEEQATFKKDGKKGYSRNTTKKRRSNMLMSSLVNVSNRRITSEWNVCSTDGDNMPYVMETYSGMFAGISNFNINKVGDFVISDIASEFRDYSDIEDKKTEDIVLTKEEKFKRIEIALRSLQNLSIKGNQNNYLTDTKPKVVILGEYKWGNNEFQGIIKSKGIDIEALKETLDESEENRISDIWIGVSAKIYDENYEGLREKLKEELKDYEYVHIGTVKQSFDEYIDYLRETL